MKLLKTTTKILYISWLALLPWQTHYLLSASDNPFAELRLYAFDILFVILLAAFIAYWYKSTESVRWPLVWICLTLFALAGCSAYWANDRSVSFYYWLRLGEALIAFGITLSQLMPRKTILQVFLANGLIQSGFIFLQTVQQYVIGNKWLGMAMQQPETSGTPVVVTITGRFLRAFGTLPHPNIAAGLLFISLASSLVLWKLTPNKVWHYIITVSVPIITMALFLTFSRAAILAWVVFCVGSVMSNRFRHSVPQYSSLVLLVLVGALYWPLITSRVTAQGFVEQLSLQERSTQFTDGWNVFSKHWATGLGIGNYSTTVNNNEPVHFTPLLIAVELGVITVLVYYYIFGWAVWHTTLGNHGRLLLLSMLMISLFDHYFWTIPTMLLLWFVVLGVSLRTK